MEQTTPTDKLAEAREKARQIRESLAGKSADEKAQAKEARAEERRAKARAKYAEAKAEKERLLQQAAELAALKAGPTPPAKWPEKVSAVPPQLQAMQPSEPKPPEPPKPPEAPEVPKPPKSPELPEPPEAPKPPKAPEPEAAEPSEPPAAEEAPEPEAPEPEAPEPEAPEPEPPEPEPEPATPSPKAAEPTEAPKPPRRKKKKVVIELESDSEDEMTQQRKVSNPADPAKPSDPTQPSDPTEPTDPTDPTDPTEPVPSPPVPKPGKPAGGVRVSQPADPAAPNNLPAGGRDNRSGGVGPSIVRTVGASVTGKGASFLRNALYGTGAKPTLSALPKQGVYAAELCNVGYDLVERFGPTTPGRSNVTMEGFAKAITSNLSQGTQAYVGELLPEFSDSNILVFRRADGHLTAAVRGTFTKSVQEVAFDAKNIALLNNAGNSNLFNSRYYKTLDAVRAKYGKPVDLIVGDSLGGHVSISATDRGLASRSVTLNPYIRPSEVGAGYHTILRTPGDPALLSSANLNLRESTEAANLRMGENTQLHVVPQSTGKTDSMLPHQRLASRVRDHSTYNFLPEHSGLAVEEGDTFAPTRAQRAAMAEANMQAEARAAGSARYTETATLLEKPGRVNVSERAMAIGGTVGSFAAGQVIGYYGAVASDKALTSLGVTNTFARNVVDGAAANVTADVALAGGSAAYAAATGGAVAGLSASAIGASGVIGASAGLGAYAGGVVADELGLQGAGETAAAITGATVNTLLGAIVMSGPENPAAWAAAAILATEAAALWIDSLFHSHDEMSQASYEHYKAVNLERNINYHMREETMRRNLSKFGVNYESLTFMQKFNLNKMARTSQIDADGYAALRQQLAQGGKLAPPAPLTEEEESVRSYMAKVGVDWFSLTPEERKAAVESSRAGGSDSTAPAGSSSDPVEEEEDEQEDNSVRQMDTSIPIATY